MRKHRRVLFVLPTGGGKTVTFSYITYCAIAKGSRIYILVHRAEIVRQISATLSMFDIKHGLIQPGRTPTSDMVQVGMVQTASRRLDRLSAPDMIVFDEAHHAVTGAYVTIAERWPNAKILGVTATPERLDGQGLRAQFDEIVQGPTTAWLIQNGFLADYDYYAPKIEIDLSGVRTRMGDFDLSQLAEVVDTPKITGCALEHYMNFMPQKPAIAFCVTVAHAEHTAAMFSNAGIPSMSIDGSMSAGEREKRVLGLKSGSVKVLTSCDLVSEGFDVPALQGAIMLRPSKSLSMIMQQWGRCLRLKEDGSKAVILDHVGHLDKFGMPKTPRNWSLDSKKRKAEISGVRQCKLCFKAYTPEEIEAGVRCDDSSLPECLFSTSEKEKMRAEHEREIIEIEGRLEAVSETPAWAGGINILQARGPEWRDLLDHADTLEKLRQIGKFRGYHHGWALHQWNAKRSAA